MKKKEDEPKKGAPAYMNTYGDMMTLLLCFFVLLFAMSSIDADKFQQLVSSFHAQVSIFDGGQTINNTTTVMQNGMSQMPIRETTLTIQDTLQVDQTLTSATEDIQEHIKANSIEESIDVERQGDEVIIRFRDGVLFDSGKAQIKAGAVPTLSIMGDKLRSYLDQGYTLAIEGHTDNQPISTAQFPSNWELSSARAIAVLKFYFQEMDFDLEKMSCQGFAEYHPIAENSTAEGRAMNRRVEIKLSLPVTE
ncbi:MAG: OmpA family protein [Cellulosilyticum sp.]|nr:OmpA family protein [Cellulosilyticum sp.]